MERDDLPQQARRLRRDGLSAQQIAAAMGVPSKSTVQGWLVGVDPPAWTRRPNAKDDERARARELRNSGMTYPQIAAALGVSKSSVSLWVRDLPRPTRVLRNEENWAADFAGADREGLAVQLWRQGKSRSDLQRALGMSSAAVDHLLATVVLPTQRQLPAELDIYAKLPAPSEPLDGRMTKSLGS